MAICPPLRDDPAVIESREGNAEQPLRGRARIRYDHIATKYPTPYGAPSYRNSPFSTAPSPAPASTCNGARPAAFSSAASSSAVSGGAPGSAYAVPASSVDRQLVDPCWFPRSVGHRR